MTDQRDEAFGESAVGVEQAAQVMAPAGISRRALIRGVSVAAPAIVTLGSGSVQAAMVSAVVITPKNAPETDGKFYCLAENSTAGFAGSPYPAGSLVKDPMRTPVVTRYPDRDHRFPKLDSETGQWICAGGTDAVDESTMCKGDTTRSPTGLYCYQSSGWNEVQVPKGSLVSISAMTSFCGTSCSIKDV